MSGGIDSSVAAFLLKKQGYECIGIYLNFWSDPSLTVNKKGMPENKCCSIETMNIARRIAGKLNMPFYVFNVCDRFKKQVVDYFIDTYAKCETPNPCVECNRSIKFGFLFERMKQLKADYIATGHYAKIREKKGVYELLIGRDEIKDQTYFLYTLTQDKLKHVLFPLGDYEKKDSRKIAKKIKLEEIIEKRESQGICFFPDKKYEDFLKRYFPKDLLKQGPIETIDGKKIGTHGGLQFFTVGQRKGIEIGGEKEPLYVVKLDYKRNALIVGRNKDTFQSGFGVDQVTFTEKSFKKGEYNIHARIRYRFPPEKAMLKIKTKKTGEIYFKKPQRAITPGQSVVFYKNKKVLGGGVIKQVFMV